jgi:hypothetical protein
MVPLFRTFGRLGYWFGLCSCGSCDLWCFFAFLRLVWCSLLGRFYFGGFPLGLCICTVSTNFEVPSSSPHAVQVVVLMLRLRLQEVGDVLVRSRRIARINVGDCCWCRTICMSRVAFRCCSSLLM